CRLRLGMWLFAFAPMFTKAKPESICTSKRCVARPRSTDGPRHFTGRIELDSAAPHPRAAPAGARDGRRFAHTLSTSTRRSAGVSRLSAGRNHRPGLFVRRGRKDATDVFRRAQNL